MKPKTAIYLLWAALILEIHVVDVLFIFFLFLFMGEGIAIENELHSLFTQ